jgi:hypothetical protein
MSQKVPYQAADIQGLWIDKADVYEHSLSHRFAWFAITLRTKE